MENDPIAGLAESYAKAFGQREKIDDALRMLGVAVRGHAGAPDAYLKHDIAVAATVLKLGFDRNVVVAGLLHNAQKFGIRPETIAREFGKSVAELIDQQERFEKALNFKSGDIETARKKTLIVLSTNPPVVIIQLSDKLERLRNIETLSEGGKGEFLAEVKELYAPLAHKLGIYSMSSEMNELAFKLEQPETYTKTRALINEIVARSSSDIQQTKETIENELKKAGVECQTSGRVKTVYSTYQKMKRKNITVNHIYDLMAIRIVTGSEKECYEALGIIHSLWKPIPGEFDDYIAKPKENGYRSLHTSVFTNDMTPIEIQIRTKEMHDFAEFGIAAHWAYKGGRTDTRYDKKIDWIKQLIEWKKTNGSGTEMDIFGKEIFAMTPKGEIIEMPYGSTVLDFAYAVHSDLGDRAQGGKVNGVMTGLNTEIKNGDVVEIIVNPKQTPKIGWLGFVKTAKAKQKIRTKLRMEVLPETRKKKARPDYGLATNDRRVRLAKCCRPLPGDDIVGFKTTKRKIAVHRADCEQAMKMSGKMDVYWGSGAGNYDAEIVVHASERSGMLKDILEAFSGNNMQIKATNARAGPRDSITCRFNVTVKNLAQLEEITKKILAVRGVGRVYRE